MDERCSVLLVVVVVVVCVCVCVEGAVCVWQSVHAGRGLTNGTQRKALGFGI